MTLIKTAELAGLSRAGIFDEKFFTDTELLSKGLYLPVLVSLGTVFRGTVLIDAALLQGKEELNCLVLDAPAIDVLKFALSCENRCGQYSPAEKYRLYAFMKNTGLEPDSPLEALVQKDGSFFHQAEKIALLPGMHRRLYLEGLCDAKTALAAAAVPEKALSLLEPVLRQLSFSERRLFTVYFAESGLRASYTEEAYVKLAGELVLRKDRMDYLSALRHPQKKELEDRLEAFRQAYVKGSGLVLEEPAGFEGAAYRFSFSVKNKTQFDKILKKLETIKENSGELFSLLF